MTSSNPFTKRDWGSLLRDDTDDTNTFSSDDVKAIKARVGRATTHQELSLKASNLVSDIVHSQNKKVILIGESSHGTAEFYETRAHITQELIEREKCYAIMLEADAPPCASLHRFVMGSQDLTIKQAMHPFTHRFPNWMWANEEFQAFVLWLRDYNMSQVEKERVSIFGMDLYSLTTSIEDVISFLREHDSECATRVDNEYSCFGGGNLDPQMYGMLVEKGLHQGCANAASNACLAIEKERSVLAPPESGLREIDEAFIAEMNAQVVQGAEQYYRSMFAPDTNSWNVRDQHFMDQVNRVKAHMQATRGEECDRVVVWAHNSHVGNAHHTHLEKKQAILAGQKRYQSGGGGGESEHEFNIGQLAKEQYPAESLLVGQLTYTGTVACADDWGGPQRVKPVRPGMLNR